MISQKDIPEPYTVDTWPWGTNYDGQIECSLCDRIIYNPLEPVPPETKFFWICTLAGLKTLIETHMPTCTKYLYNTGVASSYNEQIPKRKGGE